MMVHLDMKGMRLLLIAQKLGLLGSGSSEHDADE
jgi:hypothetical protein